MMNSTNTARLVFSSLLGVLMVAAILLPTQVAAQDRRVMREREHERARFETQHWRWDNRFGHNHYYPSIGYGVPVLPSGHSVIGYGRERYFFHSGVWFRHAGGRYLVIRPPIGVIIPALPVGYTPLWMRGVRYYYVNDVYYQQTPQGYMVAEPPPDATWETQGPVQQTYPAPGPQAYPPAAPQNYPSPVPQPSPPGQYSSSPQPGIWYYCDSARAYHPHVQSCNEPWRQVPATPPPPR